MLDFVKEGFAVHTLWDYWLPVPGEAWPNPFQHILYYLFIVLLFGGIGHPASLSMYREAFTHYRKAVVVVLDKPTPLI